MVLSTSVSTLCSIIGMCSSLRFLRTTAAITIGNHSRVTALMRVSLTFRRRFRVLCLSLIASSRSRLLVLIVVVATWCDLRGVFAASRLFCLLLARLLGYLLLLILMLVMLLLSRIITVLMSGWRNNWFVGIFCWGCSPEVRGSDLQIIEVRL